MLTDRSTDVIEVSKQLLSYDTISESAIWIPNIDTIKSINLQPQRAKLSLPINASSTTIPAVLVFNPAFNSASHSSHSSPPYP